MRIARVCLNFVLIIGLIVGSQPLVTANASASGLVISHLVVGESSSSSSEFIAIYNNTSSDIDMSGYCLKNKDANKFACITTDSHTKVYIRSHNYLTIASTLFSAAHGNYAPDTSYSLSNAVQVTSDTITLVDGSDTEIDQVSWVSSGTKPATNVVFQRKETAPASGVKLDTGVIAADFESAALVSSPLNVPANASYDVVTYVDICANIDGVQTTMPANYLADENGECQPDSCLNLSGLQVSVPEFFDADMNGNCTERDECANLPGVQHEIPEYMVRGDGSNCIVEYTPLMLSEIMPNADGSDTGNEFIEIYNPTNQTIDLTFYAVKIGDSNVKSFPIGAMIAPGEYRTFSDSLMKFTLLNTSSRVILTAIGGMNFGDTGIYDSPPDGQSWALIDGLWQYTNRPTPGAPNLASLVEENNIDPTDTGLASCPAGKYRNTLTNRCRNIESDASVLAACDADQYRNPETGRCKKISVTSLAPCKDNQYRSEETNRCRNIATASNAKPCKDNQYRSEETGRCRNLPTGSIPDAAFAVQPVKDSGMAFVGWWALGGVGLLAVGYAVWEWRREVKDFFEKLIKR